MNYYKKQLNRVKCKTLLFLISFAFLISCDEKKKPDEYEAIVGSEILTKSDVDNALSSYKYSKLYREEYISRWVETELLYQEALSEDIVSDSIFNSIISSSRKELASALLVEKYLNENIPEATNSELENYFEENSEEFLLIDDAFLLNTVAFSNEEKAIRFRSIVVDSDWKKALSVFRGDASLIEYQNEVFKYKHDITPTELLRALNRLSNGEVSIVIETEPNIYRVVKLTKRLVKGVIPEFAYVKKLVTQRYYISKRNELVGKYLQELFTKYDASIRK